MRTELEIEQLGPAPIAVRPTRKRKRPKRLPWMWVAAAAAAVLVAAIAFLVFSSSGESKKVLPVGAARRSIAISPDGSRLAVGLLDGSLRILDIRSRKTIAKFKPEQALNPVAAIAFGPRDSVLVLRANEPKLHIYSAELQSHTERFLHPNAHDLVWSRALDAALVLTGGDNDLQAKIEVFPAHPMGIQGSTAQLLDLITWTRPKHLAVSGNGSRLAISYASTRKLNVLVYDPRMRRTVSALVVSGEPEGLTFSADGMQLWTVSPEAENLTELGSLGIARSVFPKLASTSPPRMVAVNEHTRRAYTTGSLTFPEIDLNQHRITRTVELPERSAGIVLSPDKSTAYLTFEKLDIVGVVDLQAMRWIREIQLR